MSVDVMTNKQTNTQNFPCMALSWWWQCCILVISSTKVCWMRIWWRSFQLSIFSYVRMIWGQLIAPPNGPFFMVLYLYLQQDKYERHSWEICLLVIQPNQMMMRIHYWVSFYIPHSHSPPAVLMSSVKITKIYFFRHSGKKSLRKTRKLDEILISKFQSWS